MEKPIRVLQVVAKMDRGGAETMIMNIYRQIDRNQIQFDFLVHRDEAGKYDHEIQQLGGIIYHAPRYNVFNHFAYCRWLHNFFKTHQEYHIIHGHQYSIASIYLSIAKRRGLTTLAHSHSTSNGKGFSAIVKDILQRPLYHIADYRFACSEAAGKWLYREKADFKIIPNAIDTEKYRFSSARRKDIRNNLDIDMDVPIVGHVGRFCEVKNHKMLLDIFEAFQNIYPLSKLLLVGEGPLFESVKEKVGQMNLTDKVIFAGSRNDVNNLLQAMDVFVFPSLYEGLPVTLIEAQASGLPCVIANHITDEVNLTNLIYRKKLSDDAKDWAKTVMSVMGNKREDTQAIICQAGYDIRDSANMLTATYQKIEKRCIDEK